MEGRWFSPGTPVSSTKKTHRHDITEIVLKVALNTITIIYLNRQSVDILVSDCAYYGNFDKKRFCTKSVPTKILGKHFKKRPDLF